MQGQLFTVLYDAGKALPPEREKSRLTSPRKLPSTPLRSRLRAATAAAAHRFVLSRSRPLLQRNVPSRRGRIHHGRLADHRGPANVRERRDALGGDIRSPASE